MASTVADKVIGFIGGGNMAFAIGSGLVKQGIVPAENIQVSGPHPENMKRWKDLGVQVHLNNGSVLHYADIIFLCVKPLVLETVANELEKEKDDSKFANKIIISVLAGVTVAALEKAFSFVKGVKIIRSMPNTPLQVGEGIIVYTPNEKVKTDDWDRIKIMLGSLGLSREVPERMIDAVTGLSGCSPAFVYTIIEALADGAVKQGVPREMASQFAAQTVMGAAKTVLVTGKHPAVLRDEVCSAGGSTIAGVHELEKGALRATLMNAIEVSTLRSAQLGKK